ncbi:class I SAM-dependent methyltransferase [Sulfurimonas sp. HSL3-7]|uniref:class I SAM-dependent methyltransferase n=1 Tax=Sulfonitrofixus jiaomeiensis TaxID=3131938 RepID=UPI0031F72C17
MAMRKTGAPQRFDAIAREVFAPLYPVMAGRILESCGMQEGHCLDLGCGSGWLGRALAQQSRFCVTYLDISEAMLELAENHAQGCGLAERTSTLCSDVHAIGLPDASVDLVISRGSFPFWNTPEKAVAEILRVLRPGGHAFIGGGFGNAEIKKEVFAKMALRDPQWQERIKRHSVPDAAKRLVAGVMALDASEIEITRDERGFMAHFVR